MWLCVFALSVFVFTHAPFILWKISSPQEKWVHLLRIEKVRDTAHRMISSPKHWGILPTLPVFVSTAPNPILCSPKENNIQLFAYARDFFFLLFSDNSQSRLETVWWSTARKRDSSGVKVDVSTTHRHPVAAGDLDSGGLKVWWTSAPSTLTAWWSREHIRQQ